MLTQTVLQNFLLKLLSLPLKAKTKRHYEYYKYLNRNREKGNRLGFSGELLDRVLQLR